MSDTFTPTTETVIECFLDGAAGEFIEDDIRAWIASIECESAARALEGAADADEKQADYLIDVMPDAFSGLTRERFQKREEAYELRRSANRLRARAAEIRERGAE